MSDEILVRSAYYVGQTLNVSLTQAASPFRNESQHAFIHAFKQKQEKDVNDQYQNNNPFTMRTIITKNQSDKLNALGVAGALEFSYGMIQGTDGDARIEFAKNSIQGALDFSLIIRAHQSGRTRKNDKELIDLKLRESVLSEIKNGLTMQEFKAIYGAYLVIGFVYGGELIFQSTYSANSSDEKLKLEGAVRLRYKEMGFNIEGRAAGKYKTENIGKDIDIRTSYKMYPSTNRELINGSGGIIDLLQELSNPFAVKDEKFGSKLHSKVHKLLSGQKLDKINAIIVETETIGCVRDAFVNQKNIRKIIRPFLKFSNELFFALEELLLGLETINMNYDEHATATDKPALIIESWFDKLEQNISWMTCLDVDDLIKYATQRKIYLHASLDDEKAAAPEGSELNKKFFKMNGRKLRKEFENAVLKPYDEMMRSIRGARHDKMTTIKDEQIKLLRMQLNDKNDLIDDKNDFIYNMQKALDRKDNELRQKNKKPKPKPKPAGYDPNKRTRVSIKSNHHSHYWTVQGKDDHKIDCSAGRIGDSQKFESHPLGRNKIALKSLKNGKWVQIKRHNGGCGIHSRASQIKTWETFELHRVNSNSYGIKCDNGKFIRSSGRGWIVADRPNRGSHEIFVIVPR